MSKEPFDSTPDWFHGLIFIVGIILIASYDWRLGMGAMFLCGHSQRHAILTAKLYNETRDDHALLTTSATQTSNSPTATKGH